MVDEVTYTAESAAHLSILYRVAMSILHSDADAQDAVQQGLLKAWAKRAKARPECFRAWLTKITVNECHNIQRYRKRVYPVDTVRATDGYEPPDMELYEAIGAMGEKLRIPLLLKYRENYSEKEIAQALGIPISTVKSRLYRARVTLTKSLKDMEVAFE